MLSTTLMACSATPPPHVQHADACVQRQKKDAGWAAHLAQLVQQARELGTASSQAASAGQPTHGQVSLAASVQIGCLPMLAHAGSAGTDGQLILPCSLHG